MLIASLLPETWFLEQTTWLLLLMAVVAMAAIIKGADWLVDGAAGLALKLGIPKIVVGATIVSLGTTSPEAAVSVLGAWSGHSGLALGNGVGSIIADTGLIFGLGAVMMALPADRFVLSRQGWVQFGSAVLLCVLCYSLFAMQGDAVTLGRPVGFFLCACLVAYMAISLRWSKQHPGGEPHLYKEDGKVNVEIDLSHEADEPEHGVGFLLLMGMVGLAIVIFAADALVGSVSEVAVRWGVPLPVVSSTLVAFGTSLPELMVGITAIRKGHAELLVGNIIGADILNVLFVIGASALAAPLSVVEDGNRIFLYLHLPTMLAMLVLFRFYIWRATKVGHFSRWMGLPLLVMYGAFVIVQYVLTAG